MTTTANWDDIFEAVEALYDLGWTDGLPVLPPTTEKVAEFLAAGGRDGSELVGELPERRREITAEKVAANAVMAGCRPEYMPVVLAATEAMLAPPFNLVGPSSSMGGAAVLVIVNGPVVQELGINARNNLFGPGNRANSTIGRAIRLILMNACAAIPGLYDRSVIGHPGKFSYCIAEAAKPRLTGLPCTWSGAFPPTKAPLPCSPARRRVRYAPWAIRRPSSTPSPTWHRPWAPPFPPRVPLATRRLASGRERLWSP